MLKQARRTASLDTAACRMARRARGFTLIESLMVTCVTAVLTAAGVPSLKGMLTARVADSQITDFTSALRHARTQALGRSTQVTLCALAETLEEGQPACAQSGQDWSAGWMVFVDHDTTGQLDEGDTVLRVHQRPAAAGAVTAAQRSISFQYTGISLKGQHDAALFAPRGRGRRQVGSRQQAGLREQGGQGAGGGRCHLRRLSALPIWSLGTRAKALPKHEARPSMSM